MKQIPFFELQLKHEFYKDRRCPDFAIEPTRATQKLLQNHRCVLKVNPAGVRIFISVSEENTPFIPLSQDAIVTFQLQLRNPDFTLFTDLTDYSSFAAPLFTNAGSNEEEPRQLSAESRGARSTDRFLVQQPGEEERFTLQSRPMQALEPADFIVAGLAGVSNPTNYDENAKIIVLDSHLARVGDSFTVNYPIPKRLARGVWADVDIHVNKTVTELALANKPAVFEIQLKAKTTKWSYYVVSDKAEPKFSIIDADENGKSSIKFSTADLIDPLKPTDRIATMLADRFRQKHLCRIVSEAAIPYQQKARKKIHLYLGNAKVLSALPNPSLRNYTTVDRADGSDDQTEDSLFQIINYSDRNSTPGG